MDFATLALVVALGLLGPVLAAPDRWRLPVVLGELVGGVAFGDTGARVLHPGDTTFEVVAQVGFALVMFVAGSHVPVRDERLRRALVPGVARALLVGVLAVPVGFLLADAFDTGHAALYAVLLASSSAAIVLPFLDSIQLTGTQPLALVPQVAVADAACIVAVPLVIDTSHAARAALGALAVLASAGALYVVLSWLERAGFRKRLHRFSERRRYALELRINLLILFVLAALATKTNVSVMLAGFSFGLVVAAIGEPRRLARQLFAVTDGFLAPLFFVWLGASLDLRAVGTHPSYLGLGVCLGAGALAVHAAARLLGQPVALGALAAAQVGVPVAAATLGSQLGVLHAGEAGALLLGAVVTILAAALGGARAAASSPPPSDASGSPPR